jgi:hypothetical protein
MNIDFFRFIAQRHPRSHSPEGVSSRCFTQPFVSLEKGFKRKKASTITNLAHPSRELSAISSNIYDQVYLFFL